ncbi:hypothetical protein FOL47_009558 [Perkinsus chesapeaki]|uniref:Uncharacterized protein n=1 Tax=Perkinsus chesapeaki TaxID=330153 RepID=A0A7J6L7I7_PERCH|nr:hypothetical protein FOL47_009558 [Perkinsus chesapeaki]
MNDSTATALAYGIYRSNEFNDTKPTIVAFTSVGASHFGTCIVKFTKSHLTIIGEAIDTTVGGRYIDKALMEYYANEFSKKTGGLNPLDNAKSRFKLEEAVNKVKKILSANNEAVLGIECLLEDEDLNAIVTRDKLEELCKPMIDKMVNVMNKALSEANVSKDELDSVEIVGGVSRVPFIQHTIINTFGINDLSRTLNADECVARGCALQAAMLSPLFKVRDFAVTDFIQDGIQVEWKAAASSASVVTDNNNDNTTSEEMGGGDDVKKTEVFQPRSTLNMVKMLTFYRKDPFELSAHYSTTSSSSSSLGKYIIEVPHSDVSKKIKVRAKLSLHGIFSIENAVLLEEEEYTVIEKERRPKQHKKEENEEEDVNMPDASPKIDDNNNQDVNMKQDEGTAEKQQQQQEQEEEDNNKKRDDEYEEVEVTKTKTRTKKTDIPIKRYGVPGMTDEQLDIAENDETKMKSIDKEVSETDEKRNELESYVFESRDKISSPSSKWYDYLSESQRDELSNILMKTEDWIYDNYDASKAEYMDKLIDIRKLGDEADRRLIEASLRPEAEATAQDTIQKYRSLIQSPDKSYISNDSKEYIINECNKLESWLSQHKALQARQALYINPVYTVNELNSKTQSLIKVADGILSQPPPTTSTTPTPTTNNNGSCNPTIDEVDDSSSASDDKDNNNDMDVD